MSSAYNWNHTINIPENKFPESHWDSKVAGLSDCYYHYISQGKLPNKPYYKWQNQIICHIKCAWFRRFTYDKNMQLFSVQDLMIGRTWGLDGHSNDTKHTRRIVQTKPRLFLRGRVEEVSIGSHISSSLVQKGGMSRCGLLAHSITTQLWKD